jgi:hypothetical protein
MHSDAIESNRYLDGGHMDSVFLVPLWFNLIEDIEAITTQLRRLYWQRNVIEVDIRNIKVVIDTDELRAQSKDMFLKAFAMSLVAHHFQKRKNPKKPTNQKTRQQSECHRR